MDGTYDATTNTIGRRCPRCGGWLSVSGLEALMELTCVCGQRFIVARYTPPRWMLYTTTHAAPHPTDDRYYLVLTPLPDRAKE